MPHTQLTHTHINTKKHPLVQLDTQVRVLLDGWLSDATLEVGDLCVEAQDLVLQQLGVTPVSGCV